MECSLILRSRWSPTSTVCAELVVLKSGSSLLTSAALALPTAGLPTMAAFTPTSEVPELRTILSDTPLG